MTIIHAKPNNVNTATAIQGGPDDAGVDAAYVRLQVAAAAVSHIAKTLPTEPFALDNAIHHLQQMQSEYVDALTLYVDLERSLDAARAAGLYVEDFEPRTEYAADGTVRAIGSDEARVRLNRGAFREGVA